MGCFHFAEKRSRFLHEYQIKMRKQCSFFNLITLERSLDLRQNSLIATDLTMEGGLKQPIAM